MLAASAVASAAEYAPGAPGAASTWSYAAKTAIGTSYEAYTQGQYRSGGRTGAVSKVWFSVANGVLTETMYGLIHEAQIKQLQFVVKTGSDVVLESAGTTSRTSYLHTDKWGRPLSPAYRIVTRDIQGRFEIEKHIFTDADRDVLFIRATFKALKQPLTPYLILEPHIGNTGGGDAGEAALDQLHANEGATHLTLRSSRPFEAASAGFLGVSDGLTDLQSDGRMDWTYPDTGPARGAIVLTARLASVSTGQTTYDFVLGFGGTAAAASAAAKQSLAVGYNEVLARYNGTGRHVGWEDYIASLHELPRIARLSMDEGRLAYASALMLKIQEDKTHAGALIASLSNPWGDTVSAAQPSTGYKAVWPRDFYQCAMALAALGDRETPLAAFRYLPTVQVNASTPGNKGAGGWFLQKSHVDGTPEWVAVQLDQTAMPIMLGWHLWKLGLLSQDEIANDYARMLRPAADFLVDGGQLDIGWNQETIRPPFTQQERWEEQPGYSPSTLAATIAGLMTAADIAKSAGDSANSARYTATANRYSAMVEQSTFTKVGLFNSGRGDGRYYLRISANADPDDHGNLLSRNGAPAIPEDKVLDAGFLELVRYGVRRADDLHILASLPELDDTDREDTLRVRYTFSVPGQQKEFSGWRRYGNDGYGESTLNGNNYSGDGPPGQRGRVWPIFTGERGHYELALATVYGSASPSTIEHVRKMYVRGMEAFANEGLLLPEQVWDGVGTAPQRLYVKGKGTNSATPLAWTHAEYIKLLRSLADGKVWDWIPPATH